MIDTIDLKILKQLQSNARKSGKEIADDLGLKVSTLYNRISDLKNKNYIEKFTITINPDKLGFKHNYLMYITPINFLNIKFDTLFINSIGKHISENDEIIFSSIIDNNMICCIYSLTSNKELGDFISKILSIDYVKKINIQYFSQIFKGNKLFTIRDKHITNKLTESKNREIKEENFKYSQKNEHNSVPQKIIF